MCYRVICVTVETQSRRNVWQGLGEAREGAVTVTGTGILSGVMTTLLAELVLGHLVKNF